MMPSEGVGRLLCRREEECNRTSMKRVAMEFLVGVQVWAAHEMRGWRPPGAVGKPTCVVFE